MNREILFRAKKVDGGELVNGYIVKKHGLYFLYDIENSNTCRQNNYLIEENTICQYTGEKDKNGQKIFDGDILEAHLDDSFPEDVTRVSVTFENMKWCLVQKGMIQDPFETGDGKDWEVIGNIFDNQELIGETKDGESR